MLYQLSPHQFTRATPLFTDQMGFHLFCAAVLAGTVDGQVIVDDVMEPRRAFVVKGGSWCYMAGSDENKQFARALQNELLERQIFPEQLGALLLAPPDAAWQATVQELVPNRPPIPTPRTLYLASHNNFQAVPRLDSHYALHFMDETLPDKVAGELPDDVKTVLNMRQGQEQPEQAAFGFAILKNRQCIAHAMIDCIVGNRGEIGLFTREAYRQQGLGLVTAAAAIDFGLKNGLDYVHWDCRTNNTGSVRLAERLGLEKVHSYTQYLLIFNEVGHLVNWGFTELDAGRYAATLTFCEQMFISDNKVMLRFAYFLAGAAQAGLGKHQLAIDHLHRAAAHGFDEFAELTTRDTLKSLHNRPEWPAIVRAVKANLPE